MNKLSLFSILFVFLFLASCSPEEVPPPTNSNFSGDVLIANEGNFGWGEATLSIYDPASKEVQNEVFKGQNNEVLGNVFHSIKRINNTYYFVINNSSKIEIVNDSFESIGSIAGLTSPRHIYQVSIDKAFVTDLFHGGIHIVDLNTSTKTGEIALNGWAEQGLVVGDDFWVCNVESNHIYVIDIASETIVDSIAVNYAPQDILYDKDGKIWVLSSGGNSDSSALTSLDATGAILSVEPLSTGFPSRLKYDTTSHTLFYLLGDVFKRDISKSSSEVAIAKDSRNFYGLGITDGEIYVSDAIDFSQESRIYRYGMSGDLIDQFQAGVISSYFYFK